MGTINFVVLGARNSGKTCYLSLLSSQCEGISTADDETTSYIKTQKAFVDQGELPQATASSLKKLFFRYKSHQYKVDFYTEDYDGAFIEDFSHKDKKHKPSFELKTEIPLAEGLFFFLPYETQFDEKAMNDFESEINTVINLIEEHFGGDRELLPIPVCICVTKWDRSPDYKSTNEQEKLNDFIKNIPVYNKITSKLKTIFQFVQIFPVSSFGNTTDGIHPKKDDVQSYGMEKPIDFCLNIIFNRYEEKIKEFKNDKDDIGLLEYLNTLYEDLKHSPIKKYCDNYHELESKLGNIIIKNIEKHKLKEVSNKHKRIYDNINNTDLLSNINSALQENNKIDKQIKSKRTIKILGISILAALFCLICLIFYNGKSAHSLIENKLQMVEAEEAPLNEVVPLIVEFRKNAGQPKILERFRLLFKKEIDKLNKKVDAKLRKEVENLTSNIESAPELNRVNKNKLDELFDTLRIWGDKDLLQTANSQLKPLKASYFIIEKLKKAEANIGLITIEEYSKLKSEYNSNKIKWKEGSEILNKIYNLTKNIIVENTKNAINTYDLNSLELASEQLDRLINLGETSLLSLKKETDSARKKAFQQFKRISLINRIKNEKIDDIELLISKNWVNSYTSQDIKLIAHALQKRYKRYEEESIPKLKNINSFDELEEIQNKINNIENITRKPIKNVMGENHLDFRYIRSEETKKKFNSWQKKIDKYNQFSDKKIKVYITLQVDNGKYEKLPNINECNDKFILSIDDIANDLESNEENCLKTTTRFYWKTPHFISKGTYKIKIEETGWFSSEKNSFTSSKFEITDKDIFSFINQGSIKRNILNKYGEETPYLIIFNKYSY